MDIGYILLNTIVYGTVAMVIASFFGFWKILNFSLGAYMMMWWYILTKFILNWFSSINVVMLLVFVGSFLFINRWLLKYFPNDKKRDHVWLVLTLWVSIILENLTSYVYGTNSVGLSLFSMPTYWLIIVFAILVGLFFYAYKYSFLWVTLNAISENWWLVRGLWIPTNKILQICFVCMLVLLLLVCFLLLNESSLRAWDWIFYMIKGIWIMILVWITKKEYMFFGALLYVLTEYLLFIKLGLPISYKETFILFVILFVLLFKPEWLFSLRKRSL
jgi:branched-subunit amino acid ABC-type transport system permease component